VCGREVGCQGELCCTKTTLLTLPESLDVSMRRPSIPKGTASDVAISLRVSPSCSCSHCLLILEVNIPAGYFPRHTLRVSD